MVSFRAFQRLHLMTLPFDLDALYRLATVTGERWAADPAVFAPRISGSDPHSGLSSTNKVLTAQAAKGGIIRFASIRIYVIRTLVPSLFL